MGEISRRDFVAQTAAGVVAAPLLTPWRQGGASAGAAGPLTAQQIIDRVKQQMGGDWGNDDVDSFKAGDPAAVVTGIVTTSMATLDVLQKAVKAGANLVITAAPTFYTRADLRTPGGRGAGAGGAAAGGGRGTGPRGGGPGVTPLPSPATVAGPGTGASAPMPSAPPLPQSAVPPASPSSATPPPPPPTDPVYAGKNAFIDLHKLVVFRLTDHWNRRTPDPRAQGLAAAMGWTPLRQDAGTSGAGLRYEIPGITLDALASRLKRTLGTRGGLRAIGDRRMTVRRVGLLPGYTLIPAAIAMLPTVDVIVAGEVQEWESATYVQDVVFAGGGKGFISIGRVVNEAPGMQVCADWLRTVVPEVPVRFIGAGDPYWRPL